MDVAEIEAAAKQIEAAFGSIDTGLESTGSLISSLFGNLQAFMGSDVNSTQARWQIQEQLERENELRSRQVQLQEEMIQAIIREKDTRRETLKRGDAMITIDTTGLEPDLERVLFAIIQRAQIQANEEGVEALLGI